MTIGDIMVDTSNPFFGKKHTAASRKKIKENHVGMTGKKHSPETKEKMSTAHTGRNWVYKGMVTKSIPSEELDSYLESGWLRGRAIDKRGSKSYMLKFLFENSP
jgi:4-hydroxy-3-methylbut-2-enyl diphosphate reductase IspH